ncbi:MAG TPA: hypothetical protein PK597_06810 [Oscillospiraceae bacterium]|nr:hypothetical protein [Oscillospiraceae bacterium]
MRVNGADSRRKNGAGEPAKKPGAQNDRRKTAWEKAPEDGVAEMDGGVMLTKSEILDFSAGADS